MEAHNNKTANKPPGVNKDKKKKVKKPVTTGGFEYKIFNSAKKASLSSQRLKEDTNK